MKKLRNLLLGVVAAMPLACGIAPAYAVDQQTTYELSE